MDAQTAFSTAQQGLVLLLTVAAPVLLAILATGLVVSLLQAATQVHESTLSFLPKLLAALAVLGLLGPWMLGQLVDYLRAVLLAIPGVIG